MVRTGSTHDGLVIVVADGIVITDEVEIRGVASAHVVVSHIQGTLINRLGRNSAVVITGGLMYPGVQIVLALVLFLPHLIEAVERIAYVRVNVRNVPGYLVRPIRQICRKARIGHILGLALRVRRVGLG